MSTNEEAVTEAPSRQTWVGYLQAKARGLMRPVDDSRGPVLALFLITGAMILTTDRSTTTAIVLLAGSGFACWLSNYAARAWPWISAAKVVAAYCCGAALGYVLLQGIYKLSGF
jgi:hypothetical protein